MGEGEPFIRYFSPRDYHGGNQCVCAAQDARGVMYIGSLGQVLEYDVSTWRRLAIASETVNSLAYDAATDTVFVGARNNLGTLKRLPDGARVFASLLNQVPAEARDVGAVNSTYATAGGVYFVGAHEVLPWRDGRFRYWQVPTSGAMGSGVVAGELYVASREAGILRVHDDALVPVSDDATLRGTLVRSVLAGPDGSLLIATREDGLFELKDGVVHAWQGDCGDFLKRASIRHILRLRDGSLAVATREAGVVLLDAAGHSRNRIDGNTPLHGGAIFGLFEDEEGGVWACLQSGVARAEINSPFSILRAGPDDELSSADCHARWFGSTVLGADPGIFRVVTADPATATGAHLECLPGTARSSTALCTVENGTLTLTRGRVFCSTTVRTSCPPSPRSRGRATCVPRAFIRAACTSSR